MAKLRQPRSIISSLLIPAVSIAVVGIPGCKSENCWDIETGTEYDVTVKETLNAGQDFSVLFGPTCGRTLELEPESTIRFRTTSTSDEREDVDGCVQVFADVTSIPTVPITTQDKVFPASGNTSQAHLFSGSAEVEIDGCVGGWSFLLWGSGDDGNPFGRYDPEDPRIFLGRCFFPGETTECAEFSEYFEEGCCSLFGVEVRKASQ